MTIEVKNTEKPIDYVSSINFIENRVNSVLKGEKGEFLWILEHKTVYTAGTSANKKDLLDKNLSIIKTNRGGKYTLHSPGQKVIYFVLDLNKRGKDIKNFVRKIENCIISILNEYGVTSCSDRKNIGIWVNKNNKTNKIAAIGIRVKKWIAYHGFSLNINNDLDLYKGIVPCGIKDKGITSLKDLGINNYKNIDKIIVKHFLNIFL